MVKEEKDDEDVLYCYKNVNIDFDFLEQSV